MTGAASDLSGDDGDRRARRRAATPPSTAPAGSTRAPRVGARLVDRRRRPVARPRAGGRRPPARGRRHAGGPDRDAGARRRRGAARVRRTRRRRRRGRGRRDRERVARARSSSRWWCGARATSTSVGATAFVDGRSAAAHDAAAVAVGDGRRRHDRGARDERAGVGRAVRGATGPWRRGSSPRSCTRSRTARRCAPWSRSAPAGIGAVEPAALPDAAAVARGWSAQLDRGMRVELPDDSLARAVRDRARGDGARGPGVEGRSGVVAALEDWGLDAEAAAAWSRLTGRERRKLGRRTAAADALVGRGVVARGAARCRAPRRGARRSSCATPTTGSSLLAEWPAEWIGQPFDVRDAPTRRGPVSYSVRWHGERPALLWEAPEGTLPHRARDSIRAGAPTTHAARRCSPHRVRRERCASSGAVERAA